MSSKIDMKYNGQGCVPQNILVRYLKGELSGVEMNAVERHLSGCPMCVDELEGLALLNNPEEILSVTHSLNAKVDERGITRGRLVRMVSPLSAVASIAALLGISAIIYYTSTLKPEPTIVSESLGEPLPKVEEVIPTPPVPTKTDHKTTPNDESEPDVESKSKSKSLPTTRQESAATGESSSKEVATRVEGLASETVAVRTVRPAAKRSAVSHQPRINAYQQPTAAFAPRARLKEKNLYSDFEIEADAVLYDLEYSDMISVDDVSYLVEDEELEFEEEAVFVVVEEMPKFNGGDINNFRDYINRNLKYPEIAAENGVQGRVILSFVVEPTGKVSKVQVLRGVDPNLDKEAVRVIESSPLWEPGKQRGRPVRVSFVIPVIFVLQ